MPRPDRQIPLGKLWLGVAISVIALGIAFHRVHWDELGYAIRQTKLLFIPVAMGFLLLNLWLRAWRWQILLRPLGRFRLIEECFRYYAIGFMSNMLIPLRAGDIIRPYLFGRKTGTPKTAVFATVILERITDLIAILGMLILLTTLMNIPPELRHGAFVAEVGGFLLLCLVSAAAWDPRLTTRFSWIQKRLPHFLERRIEGWMGATGAGLGAVRDARAIAMVAFVSLLVWLSSFFVVWSYLSALQLHLSWFAPLLIIVVSNLGASIPTAPGMIGVAHVLFIFSLSILGVDRNTSLAFAIIAHGVGFLLVVLIGLLCLWKEGLSFEELTLTRMRGAKQ